MADREERLPLVAEQPTLSRRTVETGRVRIAVETAVRTEPIAFDLAETEVSVERVPVGRFVDSAPPARIEGDVTIIPVLEERAVVTVRLFLREELHVRASTARRQVREEVELRREQATVTRQDATNTKETSQDE
jgi:uncharacterized protein (TIGR02271 family)